MDFMDSKSLDLVSIVLATANRVHLRVILSPMQKSCTLFFR